MDIFFRTLLILCFSACALTANSQSFYKYKNGKSIELLFGIGLTSYSGELSVNHAFKLNNPNIIAGAQLNVSNWFGVRGEIAWYRISGSDSNSDPSIAIGRVQRNLSFTANNLELNIAPVVYLLPKKFPVNLYFTAGVGVTYFNPKTEYQEKFYKLRPLKTEGITYGQFTLVLPTGVGLKYELNNSVSLALEANYRFTLTDYLDDVSTVYIAQSSFADPVASVLADRSQELGLKPFPAGTPRGNPKTNDGYLMVSLMASYSLPSKGVNRMRRFR